MNRKNQLFLLFLFFSSLSLFSQVQFNSVMAQTMMAELKSGDSLVYYQCHVETIEQKLHTANGQTLSTAPEKCSITEKFIVKNESGNYRTKYFVSSMVSLPNRRFSGLKIREKKYWNFKNLKDTIISEKAVKLLCAVELKGREATEYEFAITKYTNSQIIIKKGKKFKQLVLDGDHVLSRMIFKD